MEFRVQMQLAYPNPTDGSGEKKRWALPSKPTLLRDAMKGNYLTWYLGDLMLLEEMGTAK